ncbi:MAG: SDR family oxidoreductase [Candidatus Promineifilaceae bacterium]|nr:SDR family oxidoreductase [Candidatus Promineifilaceae bacterium]
MTFEDYVVIVTGAGRGIGYGLSAAFARQGAKVTLNDIDGDVAQQAADRINVELSAAVVTPYALDVADVSSVRGMVADVVRRHGRLDVVIANAGLSHFGRFVDYAPEAFDRVTAVNLRGTFFTAQAAARAMIETKAEHGRLLFMSSVTGNQAYPNLSTYGMTKAGIQHLARVLAVELGAHGITVNAIAPGATVTERTMADDPDYDTNWEGVAPNGRVALVEDIVQTALFLASPEARHVTGQTIVVDGGWTLISPIPEETPDIPDESSKLR